VFTILRALARQGRTVITVTHDEALAAMADRRISLVDGRVVSDRATSPVLRFAG